MDPKERFVPRGRRVTRLFLAAASAVMLLAVAMPGAALGVGQILDIHDHGGNVDHRDGVVRHPRLSWLRFRTWALPRAGIASAHPVRSSAMGASSLAA